MSASSQIAFNPRGATAVVQAGVVAPSGIQVLPQQKTGGSGQYRVINAGPSTVFLGVGATAVLAQSNTVAPVAGAPSPAIVLMPGSVEVFSFGEDAYFSGLAAAATTVYITQGSGM